MPRSACWSSPTSATTPAPWATWSPRPPRRPARTSRCDASRGSSWARSSPDEGSHAVSARYQRILLKVSGEILAGPAGHGIDESIMVALADEIRDVHALGVQIGIVTGG